MECQLLYMQNLIIMGENIKIDNKEINYDNSYIQSFKYSKDNRIFNKVLK